MMYENAALYETTAPYYARFRPGYPAVFIQHVIQRFGLDRRGRLLDLGCGTGEHTLFFAAWGHRVTGIDFLAEALRRARAKAAERGLAVEFLVKDATALHDWGERFASVIDCGLMAHGPGTAPDPGGGRMMPGRRSRMDELFAAALRLGSAEREAWLQRTCGSDDKLRLEVGRLLSQNERAEQHRDPDAQGRASEETGSWPCPSTGHLLRGPEPIDHTGARPVADSGGFSPSATSAAGSQPHPTSEAELAQARQLGPYRLRQPIGAGAMGEVYLAEHRFLKRPCALKLIRPDRMGDPLALERFEREVRVTATLSHPNTVEIYDYGRTSDGTYYYVMEYLPGLTLGELVQQHGPLPPGRVVYLLRQVCQALREAHAVGLIHRDLKPSNIIAARRGGMDDVAKLLDFGLVLPAMTAPGANLSAEGQIVGTPLFMSPEQATGDRELDQRSDLYSLGAVAYYLLTGRPPFRGASAMAVLVAHARHPVVPPSLILPGIPEDLERVVLRCLAKDTADRFTDVECLERALGECVCSGDWNQDHAARWWRDAGPFSQSHSTGAAW